MTELAFDYYSHFGVLFSVEGQQILKKIKGNNVEFSITIMREKKSSCVQSRTIKYSRIK